MRGGGCRWRVGHGRGRRRNHDRCRGVHSTWTAHRDRDRISLSEGSWGHAAGQRARIDRLERLGWLRMRLGLSQLRKLGSWRFVLDRRSGSRHELESLDFDGRLIDRPSDVDGCRTFVSRCDHEHAREGEPGGRVHRQGDHGRPAPACAGRCRMSSIPACRCTGFDGGPPRCGRAPRGGARWGPAQVSRQLSVEPCDAKSVRRDGRAEDRRLRFRHGCHVGWTLRAKTAPDSVADAVVTDSVDVATRRRSSRDGEPARQ